MTIFAVTSSSGSPGVTCTAYGLAVATGQILERTPLLIEADPSGGSMALRFQLDIERSLATFSGVASRGVEPGMLNEHASQLSGVACLTAPSDPLLAQWALRRSASMLVEAMVADRQLTIADLGRFSAETPALPFASAARLVLLITRPTAEDAQSMLFAVRSLKQAGCRVGLLCLGDRPFHPLELADLAGVPLVAVLPDDPVMASALKGGSHSLPRFRRSSLWRSIVALAKVVLADGHIGKVSHRGNPSKGVGELSGSKPFAPPAHTGVPVQAVEQDGGGHTAAESDPLEPELAEVFPAPADTQEAVGR